MLCEIRNGKAAAMLGYTSLEGEKEGFLAGRLKLGIFIYYLKWYVS